ncbi:PREDICTED: protein WWC2-like [Dipodomys ordii]|uniref:Protein WWC2-like n=1 Tax=Dipodomys ordii TaxID=10020 RepID=A0A1S3FRW6_DIPOR|nr:PREDICTED: protein WWC2-like [Dipodomys ordii]
MLVSEDPCPTAKLIRGQGKFGFCPAALGSLQRDRPHLLGHVRARGGELSGAGGCTEGTADRTCPRPTALNPAGEADDDGGEPGPTRVPLPLRSRGRLTKPLSFADCVGDELPWGWEAGFDPQIGVYYIDHINKTTQIEDPRKQWRGEQEKMLKDYLSVAQDALRTQKELYHVKEQRLALALDEYVRLNDAYKEKSSSRTSCKYGMAIQT